MLHIQSHAFLFTDKLKVHFKVFSCMLHFFSKQKSYKRMALSFLIVRLSFILTNLEVTKFISLLLRCNHMKPVTKIVLLRYFLVKYYKYLLENCFWENNCDFILEKDSMWVTFPRSLVFPFTLTFYRNHSKFPESKVLSFDSVEWVQIKFPGWLSWALVFLQYHLRDWPLDLPLAFFP